LWGYGAPVSALTVHDNQIAISVAPNPSGGKATVAMEPAVPYYTVKNGVFTADFGHGCGEQLGLDRPGGSRELAVIGGVPAGAAPCVEEVAIEDPAQYGAMALKEALERRGVRISGSVRAQHWEPGALGSFLPKERADDFSLQRVFQGPHPRPVECGAQAVAGPDALPQTVLATHRSAPLLEDLILTNKTSQNLHAELFLRHLGASYSTDCQATARESLRVVQQWLLHAGLDRGDFAFYDGSGLSGHDLVTPRATVKLLAYAAGQPWFSDWKKSLPVGGVDGSLAGRFTKAPLQGRVFAKTGTLGEARALSGYVEGASGRTVIFSIMVGNHAPGTGADREVMDRMVAAIAAAN
jgi:D-alanyl-D-alanine carboxypeptidase/D-alanyl-D-alanine-endopeptidase (penicillin-binding protein 4)